MNTPAKLIFGALIGAHAVSASAISFEVTFDDPGNRYFGFHEVMTEHIRAAGNAWNDYLGSDAKLEVQVGFSNITTAEGHSATSAYVGNNGASFVYEQGAAAEIRTDIDPNGAEPDIHINFGNDYLLNDLWFDPDPRRRSAEVPADKIDAASVILHEFGHAFAFNGWRDPFDGSLAANYQSTFDELVIFENGNLFFTGEHAVDANGGKNVPLTFGNYAHLGNRGDELASDLMNGVAFNYGDRAFISSLDVAILADTGVIDLPESMRVSLPSEDPVVGGGPATAAPVVGAVPIPAAGWLFISGLFGLVGVSQSKKRRLASYNSNRTPTVTA